MKCLLCDYISNTADDIKKYYTIYHKINENNFFFRQLFLNQNGFVNCDCIRCHKFITTKKFMARHNFLKHYIDGERKPAEFKPIDIRNTFNKRLQYIKLHLKNIPMNMISIIQQR